MFSVSWYQKGWVCSGALAVPCQVYTQTLESWNQALALNWEAQG